MKRTALVEEKSSANAMWTRTMENADNSELKFVVCIENGEYPASLELCKIYRVLADDEAAKDGDFRIIDESGEGYLYPAEWFVFIDVPHQVEAALSQTS